MIREIREDEKEYIIQYIGNDYYKSLYLYMDLIKYGVSNSNVKTWIQINSDRKISAVILRYYTGMHIFSKYNDYIGDELEKLVINEKPAMICAEKNIIDYLRNGSLADKYDVELGYIKTINSQIEYIDIDVSKANYDDFYQIAKLLYEDEGYGSSYDFEQLRHEMYERNKEGFVRNYVIKDSNGLVISHASTGAETSDVAIVNGIVTDKNYRKKGYATRICKYIISDLQKEGKEVYLVNFTEESSRLYDKLGFEICCEYGKLFKKNH